jgi:hypothetical protein
MFEIKPLVTIIGVGVLLINTFQPKKAPEYECKINIDSLEKALDSTLIHQSIILGSTAIKKDSQCKTLIKTVNVLKVENNTLKTEVKSLVNKPADTIVRFVEIRKGLFGREKIDTLN